MGARHRLQNNHYSGVINDGSGNRSIDGGTFSGNGTGLVTGNTYGILGLTANLSVNGVTAQNNPPSGATIYTPFTP